MQSPHYGKDAPLFSVITVCLNESRLERTCKSLVNQTFQDFEWGSSTLGVDFFGLTHRKV
jgi:hypothetical protein